MPRTNLVAVPASGLHDLPPRWNGRPVIWRGWQTVTGHICGRAGQSCCESCGSTERPTINTGLVGDDPDMTPADVEHDDQAVRLAYQMRRRRERRSWIKLTAFRCVECGADSIIDEHGVGWNLDLSDYSDNGSVDPLTDRDTP